MSLAAQDGSNRVLGPNNSKALAPGKKRPDMSWRDHLVMLLSFGAAAEHCLMVQYLYAAYSMRTAGETSDHARMIEGWRSQILAVAREEMGHLLTVQNVLLLLGAPPALDRDDSVWARKYYPYPFSLEPLSLETLACFVYAEMPEIKGAFDTALEPKPAELLQKVFETVATKFGPDHALDVHRVGALYDEIIALISDEDRIPDSAFNGASYEFQASWDEWGRGYKPEPYELQPDGSRTPVDAERITRQKKDKASSKFLVRLDWDTSEAVEAYVRIDRMATRANAVKALHNIAKQGEAPHLSRKAHLKHTHEFSHFDRFLKVYEELSAEMEKTPGWSPAAGVSSNPTTRQLDDNEAGAVQTVAAVSSKPTARRLDPAEEKFAQITAVVAKRLAQLFNQRYRLLLNYLAHSFRLAGTQRVDRPNLRAMLMHRVFGEMYNLKTLAGLLVRAPRAAAGEADPSHAYEGAREWAGPPFEMPYSLTLPDADIDVWRAHADLIRTSLRTAEQLLEEADDPAKRKRQADPAEQKEPWTKVKADLGAAGAEPFVRALIDLDTQAEAWILAIVAGRLNRAARP